MSYGDFTLPRIQADFGLTLETTADLFAGVPAVPLDPALTAALPRQMRLALGINTEKARSEWLIAPLLGELWRLGEGQISLVSGVTFDVDPEAGLVGRCDFLVGRPPQLPFVTAPVLAVVEAKNEDLFGGLGQAAAVCVAAQRFNAQHRNEIPNLYGCSSTGTEWRFLRLRGTVLTVDLTEYQISHADRILGILLNVTGVTPVPAAA